jgi:hypothetical protein
LALVAVSLPADIYAQEFCSTLMKFGIYDQYNSAATSTEFRLVKAWMCDSNFASYKAMSDAGGALGIDVGVVLGLSGSSSSSEEETKWHQFCSSSYDEHRSDATLLLSIRSISPALMSVVNHCLDTQQFGFITWVATSADRRTFSYFARYRPTGNEKATIRAFDISPTSVGTQCKTEHPQTFGLFAVGRKIGNAPVPLTCTVDPKTTVTVTLASDKAGPDGLSFARTLEGVEPIPIHADQSYQVSAAGYSTAHQWLSTGLILPARTQLHITVSGRACLDATNPNSCSGPEGIANANPACAALGIVCGALYGKIGANGTVFFIGAELTTTTTDAGNLFLGYGDINYQDNTGSFTARVVADVPPAANGARRSQILIAR